jgi:hypothetical protein
MSKFIDNPSKESINSVIPLSYTDIRNIKIALDIINNDSNVSYEDIVNYIKWTKAFLARLELLDDKIKLKIITTSYYKYCDVIEVSDTSKVELHSSLDEDEDDEDDEDDDYDEDRLDYYDEDEDEEEDEDDDEVDNKFIHQHIASYLDIQPF